MASTKERAWLAAHQKGSKALVAKLDKAHAKNPEYQAFKQKHGLEDISSVKQVSKSQVDRVKEKARQTLAGKAYGATKGTRMGSAEGTGETLRDTVAPLTRDQHSVVKAAEREAKAAEKPAKAPKPKKEKAAAPAPEKKKPTALELIAAAAAKRKINAPPVSSKALRRIAAVGDMEHDHGGFEDLGDTQYGGRRSYSEEVKLDEVAKWRKNPAAHDYDTDGTKLPKTHGQHDQLQARSKYLSGAKAYIQNNIKNPKNARKQSQAYAKSAIKMYKEETEFKVGDKVSIHSPDDWDWHEREGELVSTSDDGHVVKLNDGGIHLSVAKHQIKKLDEEAEQIDEGMLDDYIEGKIAKHHANKHNPEINAAHDAAAEVTKRMKPITKKIAQIKKRVSYKDKTHKNYAKTRADLKDATASIQPLSAERSKHYDTIRDARNKRDSNIDSDVETYHKWGVVGLGVKKLKQKLTKEEEDKLSGTPVISLSDLTPSDYKKVRGKTVPKKLKKDDPRTKFYRDPKYRKEEVEQIDEMKMSVGTIVKLKKPIDGYGYARVKGFSSSSHTRGPTGRGIPMPTGKVTKVHVALKKTKDDAYDPGPVTHIQHDDVHSVIGESVGWMLRQDPKLAKKVRDKIELAKKRQKQMGAKEPIKEARKKYYQGGAAFADTAARLQGAINKHKERMNQIENGPEDTYHHAGLNLTTKSRVKLPAPWAKVEDK